jgi:hypothetical protein
VPLRRAREPRLAALAAAALVAATVRLVAAFALAGFGAFAVASAMTAFVSGDVSRVAAFANVVSPAALVRLPDRGPR